MDTNLRRMQYAIKRRVKTHGYLVHEMHARNGTLEDGIDSDYYEKYNMTQLRNIFQLNNGREGAR